ncbi:MAG: VOC family protein [Chloroflexota bacterium]
MSLSLHPDLTLGYVHLTVSNLERSLSFYQNSLGFKMRRDDSTAGTAWLGAGGPDLLVLTELPGAKHSRGTTGLYHFAILTPSRLELAHSLKRIAETRTPVEGFADHHVSEAIYLPDPDGNGIEIYRDRPRADWRDAQGNFRMGTDPLDIDGVLSELDGRDDERSERSEWSGLDPATTLGHMHLHVRSIPEAKAFYCDVLGFDLLMNIGSALFVSAGGYHHHIGLNTWQGVGAPPPPPGSAGLRYFTVRLPDQAELDKVPDRVRAAGVLVEEHAQGWLVRDPSLNAMVLAI